MRLWITILFKLRENFELKVDQKDWVQSTSEKIYDLLRETPPDGPAFADIVSNILKREEYWNIWKNDGCPGGLSQTA